MEELENMLEDVNALLDVARDYVDNGELEAAQRIVDKAKRHDNGTHKYYIEVVEFNLEIGKAFAEYDRKVKQ